MPKLNLTDITVQRLKPGLFFDSKTPAFGIRVGKTRRTWLVVRGENRTKVRLGHYPAMSLAEARKRAMLTLGSPIDERPDIAFQAALEAFLELPRWRPQTLRVMKSTLRHFTWKRSVSKITHEDVASVIEAIPLPSARAHALKDIRTFFNWCVPRYIPHSPAVGLKMAPQKARERILTPEELKAIWHACEGTFGTIVRLLILTGQRKLEIGNLLWDYVNIDNSTITLPAAVTKNGREHTFPIGLMAGKEIAQTSKRAPFLFVSGRNRTPTASSTSPAPLSVISYNGYTYHLKQLQKASKTKDWTLHDLRRTYVSIHSQIGTPIVVAEKLVNHVSGTFAGVRGIYDRYSYAKEMRDAVVAYEAHIQRIVK